MDLKHARTFVTIADLGTVSKAALRLRVAQPALSRQLSDFEQEMGLKLFDRVGRRLLLTSGGSELLADCRALLNCGDAIADHARQLQAGSSGLLKIAASPQHVESVIAGLLPKFAKSFPDVQVSIREGSGREMLDMLERGEIHFAQNLLHDLRPDPALFELAPLSSVNLLAACRQGLMLGPDETIEVEKLAGKPLLLLDIGFGFRRAFDAAARLAQLEPRIRFESRSPHSLLALAEAGEGVAIIPSALRTDRYKLYIHSLAYRGKPLQQDLCVLWDKRRLLPTYATAFREIWIKHVADVFPISRATRLPADFATASKSRRLGRRSQRSAPVPPDQQAL